MISDLKIIKPIMNAACSVAKTFDDVDSMCKTEAGAVLIGSITTLAREGNPEPRWYEGNGFGLNSFGMPNGGIDFYKEALPRMINTIHENNKIAFVSIAGFSKQDYVDLAAMVNSSGVDVIEVNFGCPNVSVDGEQKPIVSFDPVAMEEIILAIKTVTELPLAIKLSPYSNPSDLKNASEVLIRTKVSAVVTSNTFPNGFYPGSDGSSVLANEFAGVSGRAMLPIGLGQVRQFKDLLPDSIDIIGVGGIETSADVSAYLSAGASIVQVATLIVKGGHEAIDGLV